MPKLEQNIDGVKRSADRLARAASLLKDQGGLRFLRREVWIHLKRTLKLSLLALLERTGRRQYLLISGVAKQGCPVTCVLRLFIVRNRIRWLTIPRAFNLEGINVQVSDKDPLTEANMVSKQQG